MKVFMESSSFEGHFVILKTILHSEVKHTLFHSVSFFPGSAFNRSYFSVFRLTVCTLMKRSKLFRCRLSFSGKNLWRPSEAVFPVQGERSALCGARRILCMDSTQLFIRTEEKGPAASIYRQTLLGLLSLFPLCCS